MQICVFFVPLEYIFFTKSSMHNSILDQTRHVEKKKSTTYILLCNVYVVSFFNFKI